jgi:hypothetical protein
VSGKVVVSIGRPFSRGKPTKDNVLPLEIVLPAKDLHDGVDVSHEPLLRSVQLLDILVLR